MAKAELGRMLASAAYYVATQESFTAARRSTLPVFLIEQARQLITPGVHPFDIFGERWDAQAKAEASWLAVANDAEACHQALTMANDVSGYLQAMGAVEGVEYVYERPIGNILLTTHESIPCVWSEKSKGFVYMTLAQVQQVYHAISTNTI